MPGSCHGGSHTATTKKRLHHAENTRQEEGKRDRKEGDKVRWQVRIKEREGKKGMK